MYIQKLKLINFKNFKEAEFHFQDMNVIVGANASGKSNLIQALKFIRDIREFGIEDAVSLQGGVEYLMNLNLKDKKTMMIEMEFLSNTRKTLEVLEDEDIELECRFNKVRYTLELNKKRNNRIEVIKESFVYDVIVGEARYINDEYIFTSSLSTTITLLVENGKIVLNSEWEKYNLELSNGYPYEVSKEDLLGGYLPLSYLKTLFNDKKTFIEQFENNSFGLADFELPIYDFDLRNAKQPSLITGRTTLAENGENLSIALKKILENKETAAEFSKLIHDILPYIEKMNVEKLYDKSLLFSIKENFNGHTTIPSSLLSDGTISMTALLVALFFEQKEIKVFEEPERGIHPGLLSKLMRFFYDASRNKQVFITTHNPEMVKHTHLEDLLLLKRDENGFTIGIQPAKMETVTLFLQNDLGLDQLFIQNLLDI